MKQVSTIVVGLGAMDNATLLQVARRGHSVPGIDQYASPHTYGSSHGETRITRQAIGEGGALLALRDPLAPAVGRDRAGGRLDLSPFSSSTFRSPQV